MRRDIVYEVKYLIHCIMSSGSGIEFFGGYQLIVVFTEMKSDTLSKQVAMNNMPEIANNNLLLSSHKIVSVLQMTVYKELESAIPSCSSSKSNIQIPSKFMED